MMPYIDESLNVNFIFQTAVIKALLDELTS